MRALKILHLSDDRPGHYHLAEGVIAAISRIAEVEGARLTIARRWIMPGRYLRSLANRGLASGAILRLGYGIDPASLPPTDLVISAGGETLPANIAAAKRLGAANVFCGSIRGVRPDRFSLVVSSYERHAHLPRHLTGLKPCGLDPDDLGRPKHVPVYGPAYPPRLAGLLVGGDSGFFTYRPEEWTQVFDFVRRVSADWGTRWLISTSRRTDPRIAERVFELAKDKQTVADFIDYRWAGPGTLERIFSKADVILCSEDSSTMISEAVWSRLPVVGFSPEAHDFKPEEAEYRDFLSRNNWCRFLPIGGLTVDRLSLALSEISPLRANPLDQLAGELKKRLPGLLGNRQAALSK